MRRNYLFEIMQDSPCCIILAFIFLFLDILYTFFHAQMDYSEIFNVVELHFIHIMHQIPHDFFVHPYKNDAITHDGILI
jgi:hypothetical protein